MQILEELNAGYIRAVRTSDVAWFDKHLAPDFVNSNADGTLVDRAAFFEDMARNFKPAKALGMKTIWLNNGSEGGHVDAHPDFIDFEIAYLTPFLADILGVA